MNATQTQIAGGAGGNRIAEWIRAGWRAIAESRGGWRFCYAVRSTEFIAGRRALRESRAAQ